MGLLALAEVTHASNYHDEGVDDEGVQVTRTLRDAAGIARRRRRHQEGAHRRDAFTAIRADAETQPVGSAQARPKRGLASVNPGRPSSHTKRRRLTGHILANTSDEVFMRTRLERRQLAPQQLPSAADRIAALRACIIARANT